MNIERKVEARDRKIEKLNNRISELEDENYLLNEKLKANDLAKSEAFQQAKNMIKDLERVKEQYQKAIESTAKTKEILQREIDLFKKLRKAAKKKTNETVKQIEKNMG